MTGDTADAASWRLCDGDLEIRPPRPGDAAVLVAGRDAEWARWLGPGHAEPAPTAVVVVGGDVVGWVDADGDQEWLPDGDVNLGYGIFAPHRGRGRATRAVRLLLRHLADSTAVDRAHLVIDVDNEASLRVARALGAVELGHRSADADARTVHFVVPVRGAAP